MKGIMKYLLTFFYIIQIIVYLQVYSIPFPSNLEVFNIEFTKMVEFENINPEKLIQLHDPDFTVDKFFSQPKEEEETSTSIEK